MKREPPVKNSRVALLVLLCVLLIAGAGILSADEAKPDVNRAIWSDGGGGGHLASRFKFPEGGAGFLLVCTRQRQTQSQQSYEGGFH